MVWRDLETQQRRNKTTARGTLGPIESFRGRTFFAQTEKTAPER